MVRKSRPLPVKQFDSDDDILDEDSEEDEFQNYKPGMAEEAYSDEVDEGEFDSEDDEEGDGVGLYEPDDWDEADSASGSESGDDDEGADMVSPSFWES